MGGTSSKHEDTSSTAPSREQIAEILKKHPGVKDAHVYSVFLPDKSNAFMAAIVKNPRYDKWPGFSRWYSTTSQEPRDRDDAYIAMVWQHEDEINMIFSDVRDDLPPEYAPVFVRTVSGEKLGASEKAMIEREGWDYYYTFQLSGGEIRCYNPTVLRMPSAGQGYENFGYWELERYKHVMFVRSTGPGKGG